MELKLRATNTFASLGLRYTEQGVDLETADMLAMFLRDKIYNNKILAPIREYISNAWDAHVLIDSNEWVEVSIKQEGANYLWVCRDFGPGLNDDDMENVFGIYGKSTKRECKKQIGAFGVGAMSGYAYSDSFYVTSYHNGVKTCYVCTLGAGKQGVEIGQLYKISSEPTTESGIEISIDVTRDYFQFVIQTTNFVNRFHPDAKIRFTDRDGYIHTPIQPIHTVEKDGFVFRQYDRGEFQYQRAHVNVRMGGIIYNSALPIDVGTSLRYSTVVDVPMGSFSIPISRESFEITKSNTEQEERIKKVFKEFYEEDVLNRPAMNMGDYLRQTHFTEGYVQGQWFEFDYKTVYSDYRYAERAIANCSNVYSKDALIKSIDPASNILIYVFPDLKRLGHWHKRLENGLKLVQGDKYVGYLWMTNFYYNEYIVNKNLDVTGTSFVDIKKLKLPKLPTNGTGIQDKTQYQIYEYGRKKYFNAEELEQEAQRTYSYDWEDNEWEWYNNPNLDETMLMSRTIGLVKTYGTRKSFRTANSVKFIELMKSMGWITPESDEFKDALKIIREKKDRQRELQQLRSTMENTILFHAVSPKTRRLIMVKRNADRVNKFITKIKAEESLRAIIFNSFEGCYSWVRPKYTKEHINQILKLK